MVIFFYTIPAWGVAAALFIAVGFGGAVFAWIAEHLTFISMGVWGIAYLIALKFSEKRKKLSSITAVTAIIPTYAICVSIILGGAKAFDDGDLFDLVGFLLVIPIALGLGALYSALLWFLGKAIGGQSESKPRKILAFAVVLILAVLFSKWSWMLKGY